MAKNEPDVKVRLTEKVGGCYCGRTDQHTHTQDDWRAAVDSADWRNAGKR